MQYKKYKALAMLLILTTTIVLSNVKAYAYISHDTGWNGSICGLHCAYVFSERNNYRNISKFGH